VPLPTFFLNQLPNVTVSAIEGPDPTFSGASVDMLVIGTLYGNDEEDGMLGSGANGPKGVPLGSAQGTLYAVATPSLIGLATQGNWQDVEYNIFGNSGGSTAQFDRSTSVVDQILMQTNPPTSVAPTCGVGSPTLESNNLNILPTTGTCCQLPGTPGDPTIGIQFTESVSGGNPQPCPSSSGWSWSQPFPPSSCAQAIVPGDFIACTGTNAPNNFAIMQVSAFGTGGVGQFINGYAQSITVDDTGIPWVVTAIGTIFQYNGHDGWKAISAISPLGNPWLSVSVGTPGVDWDTWAVDRAHIVYAYHNGQFLQFFGAPAANKITQLDTWACGGQFHQPMILGTDGSIYVYQGPPCPRDNTPAGTFTSPEFMFDSVGIVDITIGGWALGNDGNVFLYDPFSGFVFFMAGPMSTGNGFSGPTVHIGNDYWNYPGPILSHGPWGINTNGQIMMLTFQ
jgi:hypothetical protein